MLYLHKKCHATLTYFQGMLIFREWELLKLSQGVIFTTSLGLWKSFEVEGLENEMTDHRGHSLIS